jgi:hypothetical protein
MNAAKPEAQQLSSLKSHALAMRQSLFTVRAEMPNALPVSSSLIPAKKRISTIFD